MTIDLRRLTFFVVAIAVAVVLTATVLPTFALAESPPQMSVMPDDGDKPDPEPPKTCEEKCKLQYERVLQACLDSDIAPERCKNRALEAKKTCLSECPKVEKPSCEERCELARKHFVEACMQRGLGEEKCMELANQKYRKCLAECPKPDEPDPGENPPVQPDPNNCEQGCKMRGRQLYQLCVREGGTPARCERRAKSFIEKCIKEHCPPKREKPDPGENPPVRPDPNECETACREHGRTVFSECMKIHKDQALCREKAANAIEECIEKRCPPKPGEPDPGEKPPEQPEPKQCEEKCNERGRLAFEMCMEGKRGEKAERECKLEAQKVIRECIKAHCPKPDEPPKCQEACRERGKVMFEKCMEGKRGEKAERECKLEAEKYIKECIKEHCPPASVTPPEEPKTCEEKCGLLAREKYESCLKSSLAPSPAKCGEAAREFYRVCVEKHC